MCRWAFIAFTSSFDFARFAVRRFVMKLGEDKILFGICHIICSRILSMIFVGTVVFSLCCSSSFSFRVHFSLFLLYSVLC